MYLFIKTCKIFVNKIPGGVCGFPSARLLYLPVCSCCCCCSGFFHILIPNFFSYCITISRISDKIIKLKRLDPGRRIFRKLKNA